MHADKTQSTILGILFITVMVTWSIGFAITSPIINSENLLSQVNENSDLLLLGSFFELIEILCIIGIIITVYPIIKLYDNRYALWYMLVRVLESVTLLIIVLSCIFLIPLGRISLETSQSQLLILENIGKLLVQIREKWTGLPLSIFYSTSAVVFQYFLYKTRLVPVFISIWGMISAVLVFIVSPFELLEYEILGFVGISMGLNEIFLGIWLIVRGFNNQDSNLTAYDNIPEEKEECHSEIKYPGMFFSFLFSSSNNNL